MANEIWVVWNRFGIQAARALGPYTKESMARAQVTRLHNRNKNNKAEVVKYVPAEAVCPHCNGTGTYWNGQSEGLTGKASEMMDCPACSDPR